MKLKFTLAFLLIFGQNYAQRPDFSMVGFATENGGTTGGDGGLAIHVTTYADFKKYAEEVNTKYIITVSGTIENGAEGGSVKVASNKTIIGAGDNTLFYGVGLTISGTKNIIIQNIRFTMTGVTTRVSKAGVYSPTGDEGRPQILVNGGDCIRIYSGGSNVWIDHCEFFSVDPKVQTNIDLYDGLVDITQQTGWITISWSYFHDHHKCHLIGSSETDLFANRKITFHHNFYKNVKSRLPVYRGATGHVFNNYMLETNSVTDVRANACVRVEKNYIEISKNTIFSPGGIVPGMAERIDNKEVNCTNASPYPASCVADIPYNYAHVLTKNVDSVKIIVPMFTGVGKLQGTCIPRITSSGAATVCHGNTITLSTIKGSSHIWKKDSSVVGTAATFSVDTTGGYTVEVTDTLGCRAVSLTKEVKFLSTITWYEDKDGDGKGDPGTKQTICTEPPGYVTDSSDGCPSDPKKDAPGNCGCGNAEQSCVDCNGAVNGTAVKDLCDRCTGGNTGKATCTSIAEAETEACSFDGVLESKNAGFKGTGYINTDNDTNAFITFSILAKDSGNAVLSFRYSNGSSTLRPVKIYLNGIVLSTLLSFPLTGAHTAYTTLDFQLPLIKGRNTVKLLANTSDGLVNIDQIGYVSPGLSKDTCIISGIQDISGEKTVVYPNPFNGKLFIRETGACAYRIYSISGQEFERGEFYGDGTVGGDLAPGMYILEISKDDKFKRVKIAKM